MPVLVLSSQKNGRITWPRMATTILPNIYINKLNHILKGKMARYWLAIRSLNCWIILSSLAEVHHTYGPWSACHWPSWSCHRSSRYDCRYVSSCLVTCMMISMTQVDPLRVCYRHWLVLALCSRLCCISRISSSHVYLTHPSRSSWSCAECSTRNKMLSVL